MDMGGDELEWRREAKPPAVAGTQGCDGEFPAGGGGDDDDYDDLYDDVNIGYFQPPADDAGLEFDVDYPEDESDEAPPPAGEEDPTISRVSAVQGAVREEGEQVPAELHRPKQNNVSSSVKSEQADPPDSGLPAPIRAGSLPVAQHTSAPPLDTGPGGGSPNRPVQGGSEMDRSATAGAARRGSPGGDGGGAMLFVGELQWWTTDAELEAALSEFGRVRGVRFFEERASGKSKGYCQVEFENHAAATACRDGLNGRPLNGRPCAVALADFRAIQQMGSAQVSRAQAQLQAQQPQVPSRRVPAEGIGRGGGGAHPGGDGGSSGTAYVKPGYGGRGQGNSSRGQGGSGSRRGRGSYGSKGGSSGALPTYMHVHPGHVASRPSGMAMAIGMMGQPYDAAYGAVMGRGGSGGYGGYMMHAPAFPALMPSFPSVGSGLAGVVAPHVNPAFFSGSAPPAAANGAGAAPGMWGDGSLGGWGGGGSSDHDRNAAEESYGDDAGVPDYRYSSGTGREKSRRSSVKDKERSVDGDRAEGRHRGGVIDWECQRERERDGYRDQREEREDPGREKAARRSRGRAAGDLSTGEEAWQPRSREEERGKRRRPTVER